LVDKIPINLNKNYLGDYEILLVENIGIDGLESMAERYSIVEFLTSVKPFYFDYLFNANPEISKIVYLDPDIKVFSELTELEHNLDTFEIILTPQITAPYKDILLPTEKHVYNTGLYNLGFLALSRGINSRNLLDWWKEKLRYECILDLSKGYFVDQLWMNLAPLYFEKVLIENNPGYNMAHWNLHERLLSEKDGKYFANNKPLIFYHFSHFKPSKPDQIAAYHTRFNFVSRPDVKSIFEVYQANLRKNNFFELYQYKCFYLQDENKKAFIKSIKAFLRKNLSQNVKMKLSKFLK
jgi:hypothetical protein